jgi:hypothetical protein
MGIGAVGEKEASLVPVILPWEGAGRKPQRRPIMLGPPPERIIRLGKMCSRSDRFFSSPGCRYMQ